MHERLVKAAALVLDLAGAGRVEAEAYVLHDRQLSVEVRDGQVETLQEAEEIGLGVRVIDGKQAGFAFTTDLSPAGVRRTVEKATQAARYATEDPCLVLPGPAAYQEMRLVDPGLAAMSLEEKVGLALETEKAGKSYDPRVSIVEKTGYDESHFAVVIMNTRGLSASAEAAYTSLYTSLVAEEGGSAETGFSLRVLRGPSDLDPVAVGREAGERAVRMLGARRVGSGRVPVVLEPYVATSFLGLLANAVNADSVQKGKSFLAGRIGEIAASSAVTLVDDHLSDQAVGSFPFDGEGTPAQKTIVIENGVLRSFLYDTRTAVMDKTNSTGNGMRGGFRSLPAVGTSNFYLAPGKKSREELMADIERGILVTEVMGMHTANPISGDFSLGAAGLLIEKGRPAYPVRGITLAGNLAHLLQDIDEVGSDLTFMGTRGAPSLRIRVASIGGE